MNESISPRVAAYGQALELYRSRMFEGGAECDCSHVEAVGACSALDGTAALLLGGAPFTGEDEAALAVILLASRVSSLIVQFRCGDTIQVNADLEGEVAELTNGILRLHGWFADRGAMAHLAEVSEWHLPAAIN